MLDLMLVDNELHSGQAETVVGLKKRNFVSVDIAVTDGHGACKGTGGGGRGYTFGRKGLKAVDIIGVGGIGRVVSQEAQDKEWHSIILRSSHHPMRICGRAGRFAYRLL